MTLDAGAAYEQEREARIARNREIMRSLGIDSMVGGGGGGFRVHSTPGGAACWLEMRLTREVPYPRVHVIYAHQTLVMYRYTTYMW